MVERRRHPRVDAKLRCVQLLGNRRIPREVTSLSDGGLFVALDPAAPPLPLGQPLVLDVLDVPGDDPPLRLTGEVAYVGDDGAGIRITRTDWDRLRALLDR